MNYNPYAAPQAAPPQAQGTAPAGAPQPWEIGEVFTRAWEIYKIHWGVLTGALVVFGLCAFVPFGVIGGILGVTGNGPGTDTYTGSSLGMQLVAQMISAFFMVGLIRMFLTAARGETPQFAMLFSGGPRFLPYFFTSILLLLIYVFGLVLLFVPAIIFSCGLWALTFFIADTNLGVIDALKSSWEAMKGHKLQFFLFALVGSLLQLAGLIACCVGMLVTGPVFYLAQSIIFFGSQDAEPQCPWRPQDTEVPRLDTVDLRPATVAPRRTASCGRRVRRASSGSASRGIRTSRRRWVRSPWRGLRRTAPCGRVISAKSNAAGSALYFP